MNLKPQSDIMVKQMEDALIRELKIAVTEKITEIVKPSVDKIIRDATEEAVKHWDAKYKTYTRPEDFNTMTHIQIAFVENIVKTVYKESDTTTTIKGNENE